MNHAVHYGFRKMTHLGGTLYTLKEEFNLGMHGSPDPG